MNKMLAGLAASLILFASSALADGAYYPIKSVKAIDIPFQVAFVDFNGTRETMIIWNVIGADDENFVKCLNHPYGDMWKRAVQAGYPLKSACTAYLDYNSAMWILPVCGERPQIDILKLPPIPLLNAPERSIRNGLKQAVLAAGSLYVPLSSGIILTTFMFNSGHVGASKRENQPYKVVQSVKKYGVTTDLVKVRDVGSFVEELHAKGYIVNPDVLRSYVEKNCYIATIDVNLQAAPMGCVSIKRTGRIWDTYCGSLPTVKISFDRKDPWYPVEITAKNGDFELLLLITPDQYIPDAEYDELLFGKNEIGYMLHVKKNASDLVLRRKTLIEMLVQKATRKYAVDNPIATYIFALLANIVVAGIILSRRDDQKKYWYIYYFPVFNAVILTAVLLGGLALLSVAVITPAHIVYAIYESFGKSAAIIASICIATAYLGAIAIMVRKIFKHRGAISKKIREFRSLDVRLFLLSVVLTILGALIIYTLV